jgi:DNA primase
VLRQELKQAAAKRQGHIQSMAAANLSECERVLVRALAGLPESETFHRASLAMTEQGAHFEGLGIYATLRALAERQQADPLEAVGPAERTLVAQLLMREAEPVSPHELEMALATLDQHFVERRQRRIRTEIADAERRGDLGQVTALITERMELDRQLNKLDQRMRELLEQA